MGKSFSEKNMMRVGGISVILQLIPFLIIGIMGYLSLGDLCKTIPLFPDRPSVPGQTDWLMTMSKVL